MFDSSVPDAVPAPSSSERAPTQAGATDRLARLHVVGLSYRTAGLALRSKLGFTPAQQPDALRALRAAGVGECMILSTCNRTELYFAGGSLSAVVSFLAD